jgi:tripartite-type tricarboxylate transporter receptor subunit TctC
VPGKTPATLVRRLNQDLRTLIALPDVRARFAELGMEPAGTTELELSRIIQSDLVKWAKVIKSSGAKIE